MDLSCQEADMIAALESTGRYSVLKKVSSQAWRKAVPEGTKTHRAMVLDLETMGLNPDSDKIIELGLLCFTFSSDGTIYEVTATMNELQDPCEPIPAEIMTITGITDEDVKGRAIDWSRVSDLLANTDLCIAHNAAFDRAFLEGPHVPEAIRQLIQQCPFACSQKDIDWRAHGFESAKLAYLNYKTGYFYDGHRALNDCEATLNILIENGGVFSELLNSVRRASFLLVASGAPFDKKDILKRRDYRWSNGENALPKGWWSLIDQGMLDDEFKWLDDEVYGATGHARTLPIKKVTAHSRYSPRVYELEV